MLDGPVLPVSVIEAWWVPPRSTMRRCRLQQSRRGSPVVRMKSWWNFIGRSHEEIDARQAPMRFRPSVLFATSAAAADAGRTSS